MNDRPRLLVLCVAVLGLHAVGTAIAVRDARPARFGGWHTGLTASQDFLFGRGTALSGPLLFLVAFAVCAVIAIKGSAGARRMLGLFGIGILLGTLGEPIFYETLTPGGFNATHAVLICGHLVTSILLIALLLQMRVTDRRAAR